MWHKAGSCPLRTEILRDNPSPYPTTRPQCARRGSDVSATISQRLSGGHVAQSENVGLPGKHWLERQGGNVRDRDAVVARGRVVVSIEQKPRPHELCQVLGRAATAPLLARWRSDGCSP